MKLWLLRQIEEAGYGCYDALVVAAADETTARQTHPRGVALSEWGNIWNDDASTWASSPDGVTVEYIGEAREGMTAGVVLASFIEG